MAFYLHQINHHSRSLPSNVLKLLTESLVFPRLTYALPVWGPAIHQDSLVRLNHLHNRALCITCGLRKFDHISNHRWNIGWLLVSSLIQHRTLCAMMDQYTGRGIPLNFLLQFGRLHIHNTRRPAHFVSVCQCRLALTTRHFRRKATTWWNLLPHDLFESIPSFRSRLYDYLLLNNF